MKSVRQAVLWPRYVALAMGVLVVAHLLAVSFQVGQRWRYRRSHIGPVYR
jgi:hypothetical protein